MYSDSYDYGQGKELMDVQERLIEGVVDDRRRLHENNRKRYYPKQTVY